jgi:Na+-driven multidrug efflux pump
MVLLAVLCRTAPQALIGVFTEDPEVVFVGTEYLRIVSWSFVASGVVFVASSTFQAIGNTIPPLVTSVGRLLLVALPSMVLMQRAGLQLRWIWYLSVASIVCQMAMSLLLLAREFNRRLRFSPEA